MSTSETPADPIGVTGDELTQKEEEEEEAEEEAETEVAAEEGGEQEGEGTSPDDMDAAMVSFSGLNVSRNVDSDDDDEEDFVSMLPKDVRQRVMKLKELNSQRDAILEDYLKERAELEHKFSNRCKPLYKQRFEIVNGNRDDSIREEEKVKLEAKKDEGDDPQSEVAIVDSEDSSEDEEDKNLVGVPEFWTCAIANIETVSELVTERDNECLLCLEDIVCEDFEDGKGFTLQFHFHENPFFTNKVLTKRYEIPNLLLDDEPVLKSVTGCEIDWKPKMCLTHKEVTKKQRNTSGKRAGQIRTVTKKERAESFFHFFSPPKIPTIGQMDEEEADAIEEAFDHDYDVALSFRSHIIPKAVLWFTGEVMEDEIQAYVGDDWASDRGLGGYPTGADGEEPECKQS